MENLITPFSAPSPESAAQSSQWSNTQRLLFRFSVAWFLLYIFFNPNGILPGVDDAFNFYITPFHRLIPWIGQHLLHLSNPITIFTNGSGDTTYDYVIQLLMVTLSILTCVIWTCLDQRRISYPTLYYWVLTILRYYLGITLLSYGFAKVFKTQFPYPGLYTLLEPYGNASPMGLAWTFMGYSTGYNLFTGFAEVIAGTLLFFRRTTAIGAFLAFIVSANIAAMNYAFDIPVKLLSTTMILMSLFLLGKNIRRLFNLFFLGFGTQLAVVPRPPVRKKAIRITLAAIKGILVIYAFFSTAWASMEAQRQYGDLAPHTPLRGIYNTRTFLLDRDTLAPLQTDTIRWKQLVIDGLQQYPYGMIKMMNDSTHFYGFKTDTLEHILTIFSYRDTTKRWRLHYSYPLTDTLTLWGTRSWGQKADSVFISLARYPLSNFRLNSRIFNWINEYPYNR
jgi:hypothetical protein